MPIQAYVGLPRNGKSYDCVANQIMPALQQGMRVVTNIPLYKDRIREITHKGEIVEFPIDRIRQEPALIDEYATGGCLLLIDEAYKLWPAGQKVNQVPEPFQLVLSEHGHRVDRQGRSMQVVLCMQHLGQIGNFARELVETTVFHTKLTKIGASGTCRVDMFHGPVTGTVAPANNRTNSILVRFKPEIWNLYKSHTQSEAASDGADESPLDKRASIWRRWQVWAGAAGVVVAFGWATSALSGLVTKYGGNDVSEANATPAVQSSSMRSYSASVSPSVAAPVSGSFTARKSTPAYRLVGTVRNEHEPSRSIAMISDGDRTAIVPLTRCRPDGPVDYVCEYNGVEVGVFGVR